ncbi:MAG: ImmA/IrrE family metallo-endopeptidase [Lachnospiraceae bacterium]|nr:ImmA/IrrE family metallo-endopeptidase [Lachnospiraceae bacterium]
MMLFEIYLVLFGGVSILTIILSFIITHFSLKKEYEQKIKLDITVEQMRMLERRYSDFLKENQLDRTVDIDKIAEVLQVSIGGEDSKISNQADLSEPDEFGNRIVIFKRGLTLEKKNFAYAHECAHLINGDVGPLARPEGYNKPLVEQLADYTAAAMLMPEDEIYKYLESNDYKKLSPKRRVRVIRALCRKYKVSEVIVLRRVKEVYELKQLENVL